MLLEKFSGTQVQAHSFSREAETVCRKVQAWIVLLSKVSTVDTPPGGCVSLLVMRRWVLERTALVPLSAVRFDRIMIPAGKSESTMSGPLGSHPITAF